MKYAREIKVGVLATVCLFLLFFGFNFLRVVTTEESLVQPQVVTICLRQIVIRAPGLESPRELHETVLTGFITPAAVS